MTSLDWFEDFLANPEEPEYDEELACEFISTYDISVLQSTLELQSSILSLMQSAKDKEITGGVITRIEEEVLSIMSSLNAPGVVESNLDTVIVGKVVRGLRNLRIFRDELATLLDHLNQ